MKGENSLNTYSEILDHRAAWERGVFLEAIELGGS